MTKLQSIENALKAINETVFQELCDSFLVRKNSNYAVFSRTGSQTGKQKTIKGTPDTFLLLPNGKYVFVEYSTNSPQRINKLKKDIEKCIDFSKTSIEVGQIDEIIICINFNLRTNEIQELNNVLENTRILLTIYTLDALALELQLHHRDLAHQYLNISLDTGQIVSIEKFITEYNTASKGIATPLDNTFISREQELANLKNDLLKNDFIIITGSPGVGKTKLALECIKSFCLENPMYEAYSLSYKHHTLLDDLYQYFDNDKHYVLFVDDANRIDAFNQVIGFYRTVRKGSFKIIATVRDYAYNELQRLCYDFSPKRFLLEKFTDAQIIEIIKAKPFNITNSQYQEIIVNIADGNPRIAIMATLLAIANQNIYVLQNVSDLFESYFGTFIKDDGEFKKNLNIKCLGLIAFFYTIPYKDKELTSSILSKFNIDYPSFIQTIDKLDRLELVEIQYENVKIPEQNLATYFFYKAFVKEDLLSFDTLLDYYFESNQNRFKESVISANNTFGYDNVMKKLRPSLHRYWYQIKVKDHKQIFKFLSTFWFYLQTETLDFIYETIENLPNNEVVKYKVDYETNDFAYNQNQIISLLGNFFVSSNKHLRDAVELCFSYAKKLPEHLPEVIHKVVENLVFDRNDELDDFYRQTTLLEILTQKLQDKDLIYVVAFFELSKTLLNFEFNHNRSGRNFTVLFYRYSIPNNEIIQNFRLKIWKSLDENYIFYPEIAFGLLRSYSQVGPDVSIELMKYDMPLVIDIINKHLNPEFFEHCKYVQDQIRWWKRNQIESIFFQILVDKFTNPTYEVYLKIDWDRIRDKDSYEFDDYKQYEQLKEKEIRSSFIFNDSSESNYFYKTFKYLKETIKDNWNYNRTLDYVIDENCKYNFDIGCSLLNEIIEDNNQIDYIPRKIFENQLKNENESSYIWQIVSKNDFKHKSSWELSFFYSLNESLINSYYIIQLVNSIKSINERTDIDFRYLLKFQNIQPNIFQQLLEIITNKNEKNVEKIIVWDDIFTNNLKLLNKDIDLAKKIYIQQNRIQNHFDYDGEGLLSILHLDSNFLIEYVDTFYDDIKNINSGNNKKLNLIWKVEGIEYTLSKILGKFANKDNYLIGIGKHYCNVFFKNLVSNEKEKASTFLKKYCIENYKNTDRMNLLIDIVRNSLPELFEHIILIFIMLTQDLEIFSKIHWRGNGGTVHVGEVIFGDLEAAEWRDILSIVEKSSKGISLLPIKRYINERIDSALEYADWERKRRFLERS